MYLLLQHVRVHVHVRCMNYSYKTSNLKAMHKNRSILPSQVFYTWVMKYLFYGKIKKNMKIFEAKS